MKRYRLERKGRRSLDVGLEYVMAAMFVTEETRTAKTAVRARRSKRQPKDTGRKEKGDESGTRRCHTTP